MMKNWASQQDIRALEVYLRLRKAPDSYRVEEDVFGLMHWLDLTSDNFASRLQQKFPRLTVGEMNLCCLQRMGYSRAEMGRMMQVKEESIRRSMYRLCERLNLNNGKKNFEVFIASY